MVDARLLFGNQEGVESPYKISTNKEVRKEETVSDFSTGLVRGTEQLKGLGYAGAAIIGGGLKGVGLEDAGQWLEDFGIEGYEQHMQKAADYAPSVRFMDIAGFGDAVDWAQGVIGEQLPNFALMLGSGGIAGLIGKSVAKKALLKGATEKEVANILASASTKGILRKKAGKWAAAGTFGAAEVLNSGEIYGSILEETGQAEPGTAVLFGTLAAILDSALPVTILRRAGLGEGFGISMGEFLGTKPWAVRALGAGMVGMATEGSTEFAQAVIEAAAVNYLKEGTVFTELTEEQKEEVIESLAAGALMGGVITAPFAERKTQTPAKEDKERVREVLENDQVTAEYLLNNYLESSGIGQTIARAGGQITDAPIQTSPRDISEISVTPTSETGSYAQEALKELGLPNVSNKPRNAFVNTFDTPIKEVLERQLPQLNMNEGMIVAPDIDIEQEDLIIPRDYFLLEQEDQMDILEAVRQEETAALVESFRLSKIEKRNVNKLPQDKQEQYVAKIFQKKLADKINTRLRKATEGGYKKTGLELPKGFKVNELEENVVKMFDIPMYKGYKDVTDQVGKQYETKRTAYWDEEEQKTKYRETKYEVRKKRPSTKKQKTTPTEVQPTNKNEEAQLRYEMNKELERAESETEKDTRALPDVDKKGRFKDVTRDLRKIRKDKIQRAERGEKYSNEFLNKIAKSEFKEYDRSNKEEVRKQEREAKELQKLIDAEPTVEGKLRVIREGIPKKPTGPIADLIREQTERELEKVRKSIANVQPLNAEGEYSPVEMSNAEKLSLEELVNETFSILEKQYPIRFNSNIRGIRLFDQIGKQKGQWTPNPEKIQEVAYEIERFKFAVDQDNRAEAWGWERKGELRGQSKGRKGSRLQKQREDLYVDNKLKPEYKEVKRDDGRFDIVNKETGEVVATALWEDARKTHDFPIYENENFIIKKADITGGNAVEKPWVVYDKRIGGKEVDRLAPFTKAEWEFMSNRGYLEDLIRYPVNAKNKEKAKRIDRTREPLFTLLEQYSLTKGDVIAPNLVNRASLRRIRQTATDRMMADITEIISDDLKIAPDAEAGQVTLANFIEDINDTIERNPERYSTLKPNLKFQSYVDKFDPLRGRRKAGGMFGGRRNELSWPVGMSSESDVYMPPVLEQPRNVIPNVGDKVYLVTDTSAGPEYSSVVTVKDITNPEGNLFILTYETEKGIENKWAFDSENGIHRVMLYRKMPKAVDQVTPENITEQFFYNLRHDVDFFNEVVFGRSLVYNKATGELEETGPPRFGYTQEQWESKKDEIRKKSNPTENEQALLYYQDVRDGKTRDYVGLKSSVPKSQRDKINKRIAAFEKKKITRENKKVQYNDVAGFDEMAYVKFSAVDKYDGLFYNHPYIVKAKNQDGVILKDGTVIRYEDLGEVLSMDDFRRVPKPARESRGLYQDIDPEFYEFMDITDNFSVNPMGVGIVNLGYVNQEYNVKLIIKFPKTIQSFILDKLKKNGEFTEKDAADLSYMVNEFLTQSDNFLGARFIAESEKSMDYLKMVWSNPELYETDIISVDEGKTGISRIPQIKEVRSLSRELNTLQSDMSNISYRGAKTFIEAKNIFNAKQKEIEQRIRKLWKELGKPVDEKTNVSLIERARQQRVQDIATNIGNTIRVELFSDGKVTRPIKGKIEKIKHSNRLFRSQLSRKNVTNIFSGDNSFVEVTIKTTGGETVVFDTSMIASYKIYNDVEYVVAEEKLPVDYARERARARGEALELWNIELEQARRSTAYKTKINEDYTSALDIRRSRFYPRQKVKITLDNGSEFVGEVKRFDDPRYGDNIYMTGKFVKAEKGSKAKDKLKKINTQPPGSIKGRYYERVFNDNEIVGIDYLKPKTRPEVLWDMVEVDEETLREEAVLKEAERRKRTVDNFVMDEKGKIYTKNPAGKIADTGPLTPEGRRIVNQTPTVPANLPIGESMVDMDDIMSTAEEVVPKGTVPRSQQQREQDKKQAETGAAKIADELTRRQEAGEVALKTISEDEYGQIQSVSAVKVTDESSKPKWRPVFTLENGKERSLDQLFKTKKAALAEGEAIQNEGEMVREVDTLITPDMVEEEAGVELEDETVDVSDYKEEREIDDWDYLFDTAIERSRIPKVTVKNARSKTEKIVGKDLTDHFFVFVGDSENLPVKMKGEYVPRAITYGGKIYIAENTIAEEELRGIVWHELGVHIGLRFGMPKAQMEDILRAFERLSRKNKQAREAFEYADKVVHPDTPNRGDVVREEALAYFIQKFPPKALPNTVWKKLIAGARKILAEWKMFVGMTPSQKDLVAMIQGGVRNMEERLFRLEGLMAHSALKNPMASVGIDDWTTASPIESGKVMSYLNDKFSYLSPYGTLMHREKYQAIHNMMLGQQSQIDEVAKAFNDALSTSDKELNRQIFDYLTTSDADPNIITDPDKRQVAVDAKNLIMSIGQKLVDKNMIDKKQFEELKGAYLPRVYLKFILQEKKFQAMNQGVHAGPMSYTKERLNLPEEDREAYYNEVKDAAYLVFRAINIPLRDLAVLNTLEQISRADPKAKDITDDWVLRDQMVDFDGMRVSLAWLDREADELKGRLSFLDGTQREKAQKKLSEMERIVEETKKKEGYTENISRNYEQIPMLPKFGALGGMWVKKQIYNDVVGMSQIVFGDQSFVEKLMGENGYLTKGTMYWKWAHVVVNPPTVIRNFVSNSALMYLSGMSAKNVTKYLNLAFQEMIKGGAMPFGENSRRTGGSEWVGRFERLGIRKGTYANVELMNTDVEFKEAMVRAQQESGYKQLEEYKWIAWKMFSKFHEGSGNVYQFLEEWAKLAKAMYEVRENGRSDIDAANLAQKWLIDYSSVTRTVRYLRNSIIGIPFLTFTVKVIPLMIESAARAPWRFTPFVAAYYGMEALTQALLDLDDDDLDGYMNRTPEWIRQGHGAVPTPLTDEEGNPYIMNLKPHMPWQILQELALEIGRGDIIGAVKALGVAGSPLASVLTGVAANTDAFSGMPIVTPYTPPTQQAGEAIKWMMNLALPPFLTSYGALGETISYLRDEKDRYGEPESDIPRILGKATGFNVYPATEGAMQSNINYLGYQIRELENAKRRALRGETGKERAEINSYYNELISAKKTELREYRQSTRVSS